MEVRDKVGGDGVKSLLAQCLQTHLSALVTPACIPLGRAAAASSGILDGSATLTGETSGRHLAAGTKHRLFFSEPCCCYQPFCWLAATAECVNMPPSGNQFPFWSGING